MWEAVTNMYDSFVSLMMTFKATDVLDIMVVSFIIYNLIKIVRETRAEQLVKGILILLVAFFISGIFNLKMLNALFSSFFQFSVLAVLIVFQPELRSALEHIGRSKIAKYWNNISGGKTVEEETGAINRLSFGFFSVALIVSATIFSTPCSICFCKSNCCFIVLLLISASG